MSAKILMTVDLGYGDAGKGTITDWAARQFGAKLVVRYNGGAQAAHNVVVGENDDRRHHTFAQVGSATFIPGIKTLLSKFMLVSPDNFVEEDEHLKACDIHDAGSRVIVDKRCPITTPFHRAMNRIREMARSGNRHGSCGQGIQDTVLDITKYKEQMLYAGDLLDPNIARKKLEFLRATKRLDLKEEFDIDKLVSENEKIAEEYKLFTSYDAVGKILETYKKFAATVSFCDGSLVLQEAINQNQTIIFEGSQGVLLDEDYGFFPHATRSKTTLRNADTLLNEIGYQGKTYRLGIVRAYGVRHGTGPFVTEDKELAERIPDYHNVMNEWQREFRVGWFDAVAIKYAIQATGGIDGLAITCIDRIRHEPKINIATAYALNGALPLLTIRKYFDLDGDRIIGIIAPNPEDLESRANLTKCLFYCKPVYLPVDQNLRTDTLVSEALGVPVAVASYGETWKDKKLLASMF